MFILIRFLTRSASAVTAGNLQARRGRLLVECLVAMLLLGVTGQLVVALAQSVARSADSARLTSSAWALSTVAIESAIAAGCDSASAISAGAENRPRVALSWHEHAGSGVRERDVTVVLARSPLAHSANQTLRMNSARSCP